MLLGFKKRFVNPIQIGTKVFTMRTPRKKEPKIGETLYMYTALRTKFCEKISDKEKLISKQKVVLFIRKDPSNTYLINIKVDDRFLSENEIVEFVKFDGFTDRLDFATYWLAEQSKVHKKKVTAIRGTLNLYHWTDLRY